MKHTSVKKMFTFMVCVLFIVVMLLSVIFVLTHAHHEHDHEGSNGNCTTCAHLTVVGNILKLITRGFVCTVFGVGGFLAIRSTIKAIPLHAALSTLVRQKTKLNI